MIKKLMWRFVFFTFLAIVIFIIALFSTPDFTQYCTHDLLICVETAHTLPLWQRLSQTFVCTYHNVICVFGGLFI